MPEDHEWPTRDSFRTCRQKNTVAEYFSNFRKILLTILDMSGSEKWDKFVSGLKPKIKFEVHKANCIEFEEATKLFMPVETAFPGVSLETTSSELS